MKRPYIIIAALCGLSILAGCNRISSSDVEDVDSAESFVFTDTDVYDTEWSEQSVNIITETPYIASEKSIIDETFVNTRIESNMDELVSDHWGDFNVLSNDDECSLKEGAVLYEESLTTFIETSTSPSETAEQNKSIITDMDYSFFDNSLFIGDSICSGLKVYNNLLDVSHVAARGNVGTWSVNNYTYPYDSQSVQEMPYIDIVSMKQPENIFIWMGMNDLYVIDEETRNENIQSMANAILEVSPNSKIYLVSITPISNTHKWAINSAGQQKITTYNAAAKEYCSLSNITYIDVYDPLCINGELGAEYDGGDGLHLSEKAYHVVLTTIINSLQVQ